MSKTYLKVTATVMKHDVQAILPSVIWNNDKFFLAALEVLMSVSKSKPSQKAKL